MGNSDSPTKTDALKAYQEAVISMDIFLGNYGSYIKTSSNQPLSCKGDQGCLNALNDATQKLTAFQEIINKLPSSSITDFDELTSHVKTLKEKKHKMDENINIINNIKKTINADYVLKQQSSMYYNMTLSILLACFIYYAFHRITSAKS